MLTLHTLASGSEGNSLLLCADGTYILVDAGISTRRIKTSLNQLGLTIDDLSAILITHEHSDHICGLQTLVKHHRVALYASAATGRQLACKVVGADPLLRCAVGGESFRLGSCRITPFVTSHDAAGSLDYRIDTADGSVGILTDTGYVTEEARRTLSGVALLVLESNHDVEWLRSGPYPHPLKQRILSDWGHLSNDTAAEFAVEMARCGTEEIILAHLSRENNTPQRAWETVGQALRAAQLHPRLTVAPHSELSEAYCVREVPVCKR